MEQSELDSIKKFYDGAEVFVTGGTGFIGKALIEKLLRSCPGIKAIYVLMRLNKSTKEQRIEKLTNNLLFEGLKESNRNVLKKIQAIEGDAMQLKLGISDADSEKLKSCSVVFHAAASVRFDDPLKSAILLNTRGTRELCNLARSMPNLKALVHVSTAYVQPRNFYVEEKIYPKEDYWKDYIKLAEHLDGDLLDAMTLKLTRDSPNTYTFTKHMAEAVCVDFKKEFNLPMVIFRPSIVAASEVEPLSGWYDNLNGPMGLIMTGALGVSHITAAKGSQEMNMCPVDICNKGMIVAAYKFWKDRMLDTQVEDIPVYNAASVKLVTYESLAEVSQFVYEYPSMQAIGIPSMSYSTCVYYAWILRIFRNLLPALIIDALLCITGNKPKLLKIQRIMFNAEKSLKHFQTNCFKIMNHKFNDLNLAIPVHEKQDFYVNETNFVNSELFKKAYLIGLQEIFKESPKDLPKARKRFFYVILVSRTLHLIFVFIVLRLLNKLVLSFF